MQSLYKVCLVMDQFTSISWVEKSDLTVIPVPDDPVRCTDGQSIEAQVEGVWRKVAQLPKPLAHIDSVEIVGIAPYQLKVEMRFWCTY